MAPSNIGEEVEILIGTSWWRKLLSIELYCWFFTKKCLKKEILQTQLPIKNHIADGGVITWLEVRNGEWDQQWMILLCYIKLLHLENLK